MKTILKTLGAAIAVTFAAAGVQAQEISIEPYANPVHSEVMTFNDGTALRVVVVGKRLQSSREAVMAELAGYIAAGSPGSELAWSNSGFVSTMSRAQVVAELAQAKADGTFDASGEHSSVGDRQLRGSTVAAATPMRVAAVR